MDKGVLSEAHPQFVGMYSGAASSPAVREAVEGADCVITDTFVSMGVEAEKQRRVNAFLPKYQVNSALMSGAKKDAIFMHCLPAHRGEEVTADVIDGPHSVVFDEAENRLHTTKALLCYLMLNRKTYAGLRP
jgi:ornithine carbamoyltransferase